MDSSLKPRCIVLASFLIVVAAQQTTYPQVSIGGVTLANHSYLNISRVGDSENSVWCNTDLITCCSGSQGRHRGDWYFPDGLRLLFPGDDDDIFESRLAQRVELRRRNDAISPTGLYRCEIEINITDEVNATSKETVYVGLYTSDGGNLFLADMTVTVNSTISQMVISCVSTGGPVTSVTWTNNTSIIGNWTTELTDPQKGQYIHTTTIPLAENAFSEVMACNVYNNKPSSASLSAHFTVNENQNIVIVTALSKTFSAGELVRLKCPVTSEGSEVYQWTFLARNISNRSRILHISSLKTSNAGNYTCDVGSNQATFLIVVRVPVPSPVITTQTDNFLAGSRLIITCNYSLPHVDTDHAIYSNITWKLHTESEVTVNGSTLVFPSLNTYHSGKYYCILSLISLSLNIEIEQPSMRESISVTVKIPAPTIEITLNYSHPLYTGTGLTISCSVTVDQHVNNNEMVDIKWSHQSSPERYLNTRTGLMSNLTIYSLSNEDNGTEVLCSAIISDSGTMNTSSQSVLLQVYDPLFIMVNDISSNSMRVSWRLGRGLTATRYTIAYTNFNTECFNNSNSMNISGTQVVVMNLQEGTMYNITVTANLQRGGVVKKTFKETTPPAVPKSYPSNVKVKVKGSTVIEVLWGPVDPCVNKNGHITGYSVRFGVNGTEEGMRTILNQTSYNQNGGMLTISGLTKETFYTVEVAANTSAGIGVYSNPVTITTPDNVFLSLNGRVIPNHGFLLISDIKNLSESALICHTNLSGNPNSGGDWYKPNGPRVQNEGSNDDFVRNRDNMLVRLIRGINQAAAQGIYRCEINDLNNVRHTLYAGLYSANSGDLMVSKMVLIEKSSSQYALICTSSGGPATSVTWTRNSNVITKGTQTVLNNPITANYTHSLILTSLLPGLYKCKVQNNKPSNDSAEYTLSVFSVLNPVSNMVVKVKDGSTVMVHWSYSEIKEETMFRVYYAHPIGETIQTVNSTHDSYHEKNSSNRVYTVSVQVVTDQQIPSDIVGPLTVRVPEQAGEILVTVVNQRVNITWQDTPNPNDFHWNYIISVYDNTTESEIFKEVVWNATTLIVSKTGFVKGVLYTVFVYVNNSKGKSEAVNKLFYSEEDVPSRGPDGVTIERLNDTHMLVSWRGLSLVDARGYLSHYSIHYWPVSDTMKITIRNTTNTSLIVGGLSAGENHVVKISANTGAGSGPFSKEITLSPFSSATGDSIVPTVAGVVVVVLVLVILSIVLLVILISWKRFHRGSVKIKSYRPPHPSKVSRKIVTEREIEMESVREVPEEQTNIDVRSNIPDKEFPEYVRLIHSNGDHQLEAEYKSLESVTDASCKIGGLSCNISHNRFKNIFPYDHTRVKLKGDPAVKGSDYINASFIDGYNNKAKTYIASQGPTELTIDRFWEMVWQYKVTTIVMLTRCVENGKVKCEQYWPEHTNATSGRLNITTTSYVPSAEYQIRKMIIKPMSGTEGEIEVTHMHYTAWPDHGVPHNAMSLISFIHQVRKEQPVNVEQPLLVHCSAGVGRTGTFILLDLVMQQLKREGTLSVYHHLKNMRSQRMKLVQTQVQYGFIYDSLNELVVCGETEVVAADLRIKMARLQKPVPGDRTNITGYQKQYQILEEVSSLYQSSYLEAQAEHNAYKNRFPDKLPSEKYRVRLKHGTQPGSDYINASFIDGYKQRKAYIATQGPLAGTADDLWRMIWENQCSCVVMLCQNKEQGLESCYKFWPDERGTEFGRLKVKMSSERVLGDITERRVEMEDVEGTSGTQRHVTLLQLTSWAPKAPPHPTAILSLVDKLSQVQRSAPSRHTIIMCSDGVGRTGTFICIHSQLERLKTEGVVDIFQSVKSARIQRAGLVSDPAQYTFCYNVVATYLDSFETYANFKDVV